MDDAASGDDIAQALDGVAPRLRRLRTQRGRTLADVSAETGVGVSTLSRLESGRRRPTLDLLLPLARAYRVPLDDLVGAPPSGDPRVHPKAVRRNGMVFIPLTRNAGGIQAFKLILPGRRRTPPKPQRHDGFEWVYVLGGSLELQLGDTVTVLDEGEAAEFETRTPHAMRSATEHPVELLSLFSPQGEQIHLRDA
jgi:transcriptional regulator with XRE-family HTH domain